MNILYYDLTYPIGHKYYEEKMIENISKVCNLTVLCPRNWYRKTEKTVSYRYNAKELPCDKASTGRIFFNAIHNTIEAKNILCKNEIDGIVIGKHDLFSMPFVLKLLGGHKPVFLIQHNEIDQLNIGGKKGKIKRVFFNLFKDKVTHCVLEDFIKDYLIRQEGISCQKICCWPHPIEREIERLGGGNEFDCIGLSSSNNDRFISDLCNDEMKSGMIKESGYHVVLRSKKVKYDNGFLKVYTGWIKDEDYKNYFNNARSVLIAFKEGYRYRVSASIFDAFSHQIPVLCTDMPLAQYYKERYPGICFLINENLSISIKNIIETDRNDMKKEFESFWKHHSDSTIQETIARDFDIHIKHRK